MTTTALGEDPFAYHFWLSSSVLLCWRRKRKIIWSAYYHLFNGLSLYSMRETCLHIDSISYSRRPTLGFLFSSEFNIFFFFFFSIAFLTCLDFHHHYYYWSLFCFFLVRHLFCICQNSSGGNSSSEWAKPSCWLFWRNIAALCSPWAATCLASCRIWAASIRRWRRRTATRRPTTSSYQIITTFPSVASRNKDVWRCTSARPWPRADTYGPAFSKYVDSIFLNYPHRH